MGRAEGRADKVCTAESVIDVSAVSSSSARRELVVLSFDSSLVVSGSFRSLEELRKC